MKNKATLLLLALCFTTRAFAQLASWEVSGVNASATNPFAANSLGSSVSAASLSLGAGVSASSSADTFGGSGFDQVSLSAAITNADYISFSITPTNGFSLGLSSISFNTGVATAVTNFNVALLSSATGFTSSDTLYTYSFSTSGASAQNANLTSFVALQNATTALEFRLYGFRDTAGTSTFRVRNLSGSDLVISGTASAIPEPSTTALLAGLATLSLAFYRRRSG
jgi:hypothetical protein